MQILYAYSTTLQRQTVQAMELFIIPVVILHLTNAFSANSTSNAIDTSLV